MKVCLEQLPREFTLPIKIQSMYAFQISHVLALALCLIHVLIPAQLHDLLQLKQENSYLTTIARQISPYILSIAKVKERLEPRYCIWRMHSHNIALTFICYRIG